MTNFQINLNKEIAACKLFLQSLDANIDIVQWFQDLCLKFTNLINLMVQSKDLITKEPKEALFLHLKQCCTLLALLINVFVLETEVHEVLTETRKYCTKQLLWCLDGILTTFTTDSSTKNSSGNFINWMDNSLDKLAEICETPGQESATFMDARLLVEEVLCHAMSIAQIALPQDSKIIKGGSQTVLNSMSSLLDEIKKPEINGAMLKLYIDASSSQLCALESKINTAVLRLSLEVFSEYGTALRKIKDFCFDKSNMGKTEDLDGLVADFDLHVDRIMQIGLFAVSVTNPADRIIKIRSYLASLEGLESELVPAFTAVLKDHSIHNMNHALLLQKHWTEEANHLQKLIFLIIDPLAFCQVVHEENKQITNRLTEVTGTNGINKQLIQPIINNSFVLKKFLPIAIEESQRSNNLNDVTQFKTALSNFKIVNHELKAACNSLLINDSCVTGNASLKILKRCKVLLTVIRELKDLFLHHDYVDDATEASEINDIDEQALTKIIDRGSQILKDRSILYRTVENGLKISAIEKIQVLKGQRNKSMPLSKLIHLRKFGAMGSKINEISTMQITDILEDITNLSCSLYKL